MTMLIPDELDYMNRCKIKSTDFGSGIFIKFRKTSRNLGKINLKKN